MKKYMAIIKNDSVVKGKNDVSRIDFTIDGELVAAFKLAYELCECMNKYVINKVRVVNVREENDNE